MEPLERMGARIESIEGHAPLIIHGGRLQPIAYRPEVPSAQVKAAILFAGLYADGTTSVTEPAPDARPYRARPGGFWRAVVA